MSTFLISTIIRNREKFLHQWFNQIKELVTDNLEHTFYLSVYENDSIDKSAELLKQFDYSFLQDSKIEIGNLNIPFYGSIKNDQRVQYLAQLRNRTLFNNTFLEKSDYIISIEPDVKYKPSSLKPLINDKEYDILSVRSIEIDPPPATHLYDGWGTRLDNQKEDWPHNIVFNNDIIDVWTTYNCICKYKSKPIKEKIAYDGYNKRLKKFDCDTAVICENFRENGYNKIGIYPAAVAFHSR
jgi:hypothetical protein